MNAELKSSISRRTLLQASGAVLVTISISDSALAAAADGKPALVPTELDSWLAIGADGKVTVFSGKIDMGQGVDIALAQITADELDVPMERVAIVSGDSAVTINAGDASGSNGVATGGPICRAAAAEARRVMLDQAALVLGAPAESLTVQNGVVSVTGNKAKSISYGKLVGGKFFHTQLEWNGKAGIFMQVKGTAKPKRPEDYKIVGTSLPRRDIAPKVFATGDYICDIRVPGMLHGRVIRPPMAGAIAQNIDEASIADIKGARVVRKGDFFGVVANSEWDAIRAARQLKITWSNVATPFPKQEALYDFIRNAPSVHHQVIVDSDKVDPAFANAAKIAAKIVEADYEWPFHSHASMGPGCAVADIKPDSAMVWTGSQKPHSTADGVAKMTGLPREKVRSLYVYGPGAYGRNDQGDAAIDAALLSQAVGKPVRVQYMRTDATGWDPKCPPSVHHIRAALDESGTITAFEFYSKGPSKTSVAITEDTPGSTLAGELLGGKLEAGNALGGPENHYTFAAKRVHWDTIAPLLEKTSPLRTSHMRDPSGPQIQFASESFMDELAFAANADPADYRLRYLKSAEVGPTRATAVIKAAVEKSGWTTGPAGARRTQAGDISTGMGIAYAIHTANDPYPTEIAVVAHVEVNKTTGRVWVRRVTVAHDCGLVINPGGLKLTIEGNVVQSISRTIWEEVNFTPENVASVDWVTYPILDAVDAPETVDIVLLGSQDAPASGAGESTMRVMSAAINNAVFEATGIRFRRAPLSPSRIKAGIA